MTPALSRRWSITLRAPNGESAVARMVPGRGCLEAACRAAEELSAEDFARLAGGADEVRLQTHGYRQREDGMPAGSTDDYAVVVRRVPAKVEVARRSPGKDEEAPVVPADLLPLLASFLPSRKVTRLEYTPAGTDSPATLSPTPDHAVPGELWALLAASFPRKVIITFTGEMLAAEAG